ncbi:MAG: hypothetical protein OXE95_00370 [Chloroflexi bacterium]|nr:hypothetical protein [Chloroflexota bacterium]MCY4246009.1 hypothetical protein [Chloroflexota bacterium]
MNPPQSNLGNPEIRRRSRLNSCLLWVVGAAIFFFMAGLVALASAYAGWSSGAVIASANASSAAEAEVRQQCALLPDDLAAGNLALAGARIESLRRLSPPPDCLGQWSPMATQAWLASLPSPTPTIAERLPTATALPTQVAPAMPTMIPNSAYDLDALLAEAQQALAASDYYAAIDTLDAIISLDPSYQRELTRELILQALTTQARLLFESGKLSEAVVLSERAELVGNIGELAFLREVALMLQNARLFVGSNPSEAVRLMRRIVYDFQTPRLMTFDMVGELQAALAAYGDWLLPSDACAAQTQYAAALDLQPLRWTVRPDSLTAKRERATQACDSQPGADSQSSG